MRTLSPDQLDAVEKIIARKCCIFAPDCGFGKTITGLTVVANVATVERPALIVSTAAPAKETWSKEHLLWEHTKDLNIQSLMTPKVPKRLEILENSGAIAFVISYGMLKWLAEHNRYEFSVILADEGSCLKAHDSKFRKYLSQLSNPNCIRVLMSATPKSREADDYYGLCAWVDGGKTFGKTISRFRDDYMRSVRLGGTQTKWEMKSAKHSQQVLEKASTMILNYALADRAVVNVEVKHIWADLAPESQAIYEKFREDSELTVNSVLVKKAQNKMMVANISANIASGFVYEHTKIALSIEDLKKTDDILKLLRNKKNVTPVHLFHDRMQLLVRVLKRIHEVHGVEKPICICYTYTAELKQLKWLIPTGVSDKDYRMEDWDAGKIPFLFLQYNRSCKGINLQNGGHIMVFYSMTFAFEQNYQIIRRLARQGQKADKVYLYILGFNNTVDNNKVKTIQRRALEHDNMLRITIND